MSSKGLASNTPESPSEALQREIEGLTADGYQWAAQTLVLGLPEGFALMLTPKKTRYVGISDTGELSGEYTDRTAAVNWCRYKAELRADAGFGQLISQGAGRR